MASFTYAELFAGIKGFGMALDVFGGQSVFESEIDKYARLAIETLYPENNLHGDITEIDVEDIPEFDLLVGGFPCQAFSVAGLRKGAEHSCLKCGASFTPNEFTDTKGHPCTSCGGQSVPKDSRGTLFAEIIRVASHRLPKVMLLENVKGLISHQKGETLRGMFLALNNIGYLMDYTVLNSKYFGVAQNRERVFIVAVRADLIDVEAWTNVTGNNMLPKSRRNLAAAGIEGFNFDWPSQKEVTVKLRDILEPVVDEKYYLAADKAARLIKQLEEKEATSPLPNDSNNPSILGGLWGTTKQAGRMCDINAVSPALTTTSGGYSEPIINDAAPSRDYKEPHMIVQEAHLKCVGNVNPSGKGMNGSVYSVEAGLSPTLTTNKGEGLKIIGDVYPVLTPDRPSTRQEGRRFKENDEEAFTLTTHDKHGVMFVEHEMNSLQASLREEVTAIAAKSRHNTEIGITFKENGDIRPHRMDAKKSGLSELNINHTDNTSFTVTAAHAPKIYGDVTKYRIRKLTPLECFRLQAVEDEVYHKLKAANISDSQLYKITGNMVTVSTVKAVAERLIPFMQGLSDNK